MSPGGVSRLLIAGVDEAGRGPLAGPVVAAAVVLDEGRPVDGLADSKRLSPSRRQELAARIRERAVAWSVAAVDCTAIDRLNILQASLLAMRDAVAALDPAPDHVLVDGCHCPPLDCGVEAVVGGDRTRPAISAASILAKVARDATMVELDRIYPVYGFARHKGYPTREHRAALERHGPCPEHRRSYEPVRRALRSGIWKLESGTARDRD